MAESNSNAPSGITPQGQASNPAASTQLPPQTTAIVLSGGGAKGDFEVGAVRCLYNQHIRPQILCGTSVGSVNALKLAEGEDSHIPDEPPSGFVRGLRGLEKIWLSLEKDQDMWQLEPGVADLFNTLKQQLPAEIASLTSDASNLSDSTIGGFVSSLLGVPGFAGFLPQLSDLTTIKNQVTALMTQLQTTLQEAENIRGFINYDPLEQIMRRPSSFFASALSHSGIKLRLAMVALEDGALRYVDEGNQMIERDGRTTALPARPSAAEVSALEAQIKALKTEIAGMQPKSPQQHNLGPVTKPEPGLASQVNKLGILENKLANWRAMVAPDLLRAAIASSSIPLICRPTTMQDGRTYIDGAARALAPVEAAIRAGATRVFAVAAGSRKFDSMSMDDIAGSAPLPLLGIALRVGAGILPDEVGRRDLFPAQPWPVPVVVIQPDPALDDLHDGLTLEPGLIRIQMAYGFMRAYDTLHAYAKQPKDYLAATRENSSKGKTIEIVELRKKIWAKEFPANGKEFILGPGGFPPAPYTVRDLPAPVVGAHEEVRQMKLQLASLVEARMKYYADPVYATTGVDSLPDDWSDWSTQWEKHSWTPSMPL